MSESISKAKLMAFKVRITTEINALETELEQSSAAAATVELDQNRQGRVSRIDAMQGQAMAQAGRLRLQTQLESLKAALQRTENGDFGRCEECDDWIALARLELDPGNTLCVHCAQSKESFT